MELANKIDEKRIRDFINSKKGKYVMAGFFIGLLAGLLFKIILITAMIMLGGFLVSKAMKKDEKDISKK